MSDDAEVNCVRCVPYEDFGLLFGGTAVDRLILPKAGEPGGLLPGRLVQRTVDLDRQLQPGNGRGGRALPLDDGAQLGAGGLQDQQECEHYRLNWKEIRRGPAQAQNSKPGDLRADRPHGFLRTNQERTMIRRLTLQDGGLYLQLRWEALLEPERRWP